MVECLGEIFASFIAVLLGYFIFRNPQGLYGAYIVRQVEKGKIVEGKKYYPQFFEENEAAAYAVSVTILQGLFLFCIDVIFVTLRFVISSIIFGVLAFFLGKKIFAMVKAKKAEFRGKYGQDWKSVYRLYYCVGISDLIIFGWKILGFAIVLGTMLADVVIPRSETKEEEERRIAREEFERRLDE